ncbi:MAG: hypothetical protein LBL87_07860 [Ruminococcus sp.]|jgi:hypothetical protein|nr:hypothetical protein [Ruminococcus sp.]
MNRGRVFLEKFGLSICAFLFWFWALVAAIAYLPNSAVVVVTADEFFLDFVAFLIFLWVFTNIYFSQYDPRKLFPRIKYGWFITIFNLSGFMFPAIVLIIAYIFTFNMVFLLYGFMLLLFENINVIIYSLFSRIKWLIRDLAASDIMKNNAIIAYDIKQKIKLSDMDPSLFSEPEVINIYEHFDQGVCCFDYLIDKGEYKAAYPLGKRLLACNPHFFVNKKIYSSLQNEMLIVLSLSEVPAEEIQGFYNSIADRLKSRGKDVSKAAAEYAYFALAAKNIEAAKAARARFYTHFDVILHPNDYFEKKIVDEIDKRLSAIHNQPAANVTSEVSL